MEQIFETIKWWFVLELVGLSVLPLSAYLFDSLSDRGVSVSKILGILLLTYFSWLLVTAGFVYGNTVLLVSIFFIGIISFFCYCKKGLNIKLYTFLINELFFSAAFIVFLLIRSYSPNNYFVVGEKFMDITFINAVIRSTDFPLFDPWFAGATASYYYFGYIVTGSLMKLINSNISIGFNIASAAFYAISMTAAFGIGYNLTSKMKCGIITSFFATIIGNLAGFIQLIVIIFLPAYYKSYYVNGGDLAARLSHFSLWPSELIIPGTQVQFPFFSFLIGDLHPNFIAIPFQLLVITILVGILRAKKISNLRLIMLGLSVGFLFSLNTWDYPVYIFLSALVLLLLKETFFKRLVSFLIVLLSFIAYAPYNLIGNLHPISVVMGNRTGIQDYFLIFGLFLFLLAGFLLMESLKIFNPKKLFFLSIILLLSIIASLVLKFQLLVLLIPLALSLAFLVRENDYAKQAVFILIAAGIVFSLFAEIFYIEDPLKSTPYFRSNTIYKLYDQIWIFYALAGGYIFYHSWNLNKIFAIISCIFIVMSSIFPIAAGHSKTLELKDPPTIDGDRYLNRSYPYEYEAIEWFRKVNGTPVVLQASGYTGAWNSYISAFTGLPTVLGWEWHEYSWRMNLEEINIRRSDVETVYASSNYEEIKSIIEKYNIKYIYIGPVERDRYKITGIFEQQKKSFKLVFKNPEVEIYEIQ